MKKIPVLLLLLAMVPGLCACGPAAEEEAAFYSGINLRDDGAWTVELEANPTTGYEWTWFLEGNDILTETACDYIPEDTGGLRDGAGGICVFRFAPKAEGEAVLHFRYARPWEEDAEPAQTWSVTVSVRQEEGRLVIVPPGE